jgi:hypothetical protein
MKFSDEFSNTVHKKKIDCEKLIGGASKWKKKGNKNAENHIENINRVVLKI